MMKQTNQSCEIGGEKKLAMKVSGVTIVVNLILSVFKLIIGIVGKSDAMISDAAHSASDVISTFFVMIGVNLSNKDSDEQHPYGHARFECVTSVLLAALLLATGLGIGFRGICKIATRDYVNMQIPSMFTLIAAIISCVTKEWMYWYTRAAAKRINSGALLADAWHHRSDALSSIGAFFGILGSNMGFPILDSVASVVISLFIVKAAFSIGKDAFDKMVDKACDTEIEDRIKEVIQNQDGVIHIDIMNTRLFGTKMYVDVEISADGDKTLNETHDIAQRVHDTIEKEFPTVKHCMVHVNPYIENSKDSEESKD